MTDHGSEAFRKRAETLALHREMEGKWPMNAKDMHEYLVYLGVAFPDLVREVPDRIRRWKEKTGLKAVAVDVAGRADGRGIGADMTIKSVLTDPDPEPVTEDSVTVEGDLLSRTGQANLLGAIDALPARPLLVFFRPGGAMHTKEGKMNASVAARLLKLFEELYARLDQEGEIIAHLYQWDPAYAEHFRAYLESRSIPFAYAAHTFRIRKGEAPTQGV